MQLEDKANPTYSQETSNELLQKQEEVVHFIPKFTPNVPQKKRKNFSRTIVVTTLSVLGIVGVLIILPSLMSCGSKGRQAEARQNIGAMNRAQQAYFLEKKAFANSVVETGVGIQTQTVNYDYSIRATKTAVFNYGIARQKEKTMKSYVGAVFAIPATNLDSKADKKEMTTLAVVCEALKPGSTTPTAPTIVKNVPTCGAGARDLRKQL